MTDSQSDDALVEWLEAQIATETHHAERCYSEADKFAAVTDYDWTPAVNSWRYHGDQATERLNRWKGLRGIITDRDEWRQQHKNLLSVRQSDLEALHAREAAAKAEAERLAEALKPFGEHPDLLAPDDWAVTQLHDGWDDIPGVTAGDFRRARQALATHRENRDVK